MHDCDEPVSSLEDLLNVPLEDRIRARADAIYRKRTADGDYSGTSEDDWYQAEREIERGDDF